MEHSIVLLSTMSAKPKRNRKLPQKPPSKLALKKNIRKSLIIENSKVEESIITIDTSDESVKNINPNENIIKDENEINAPERYVKLSTELKYTRDYRSLSIRKYNDIKQWVSDVNSKTVFKENLKKLNYIIENSNLQKNNELSPSIRKEKLQLKLSGLLSEINNSHYVKENTNTFVIESPELFAESSQKSSKLTNQLAKSEENLTMLYKNMDTFNGKKDVLIEDDKTNTLIVASHINLSKEAEDCNKSDKSNDLLIAFTKRRSKKLNEITSSVIIISDDENDLETYNYNKAINLKNIYKEINIENSFNGSLVNKISNKLNRSNSSNESTHKDKLDILDNLYGNTWRQNQELVLSNIKPKQKKNTAKSLKVDRKISVIHKNPYIETEKIKSDEILRSLQIKRTKIISKDSPWVNRLKDLCDSETSSNESFNSKNYLPKILNFDDGSESETDIINKPLVKEGISEKDFRNKAIISPKIQRTKTDKENRTKSFKILPSGSSSLSNEIPPLSQNKKNTKEEKTVSFLASLSVNVSINKCDMVARMFRNNFKTYRNELTNKLFELYNENIFMNAIPKDTNIQWSERMRHTAGVCSCIKTTRRTGVIERRVRITLSTKVLDSADRLRDTLVHEMCHAATWIVSQVAGGHGPQWQLWTQKARTIFPELPPIKRCHDYEIHSKYTYRCTNCGYSIARHTKSLDIERKRCGNCYGKFEILINKTSKKGEKKTLPVQTKKPVSGFALFVKENYANFKSPKLKHGDVMKILGQKFTELKVD